MDSNDSNSQEAPKVKDANLGPTVQEESKDVSGTCEKSIITEDHHLPLQTDKCQEAVGQGRESNFNNNDDQCTPLDCYLTHRYPEIQSQDWEASQQDIKNIRRENERLKIENKELSQALEKVFQPDQIDALTRPSGRVHQWSDITTKKAMHLYFTCGTSGYDLLGKQGWPLPSISTLNRRMRAIRFEPGTLEEMFFLLETKMRAMDIKDRECVLMCDEMGIQAKLEYNPSLQRVFGYPTIPESRPAKTEKTELATKMLVFMLSGVANHWKQVIRYDYTGKSFHSATVAKIIRDLIERSFNIGLNVSAVVMDMGPGNIGV